MLKKINLVSKRKEVEELRKARIVYQSPIFGMLMLDKKDDEKRFLMVISKRISKKAVTRNKLKRQMTEVIRLNLSKIRPGVRAGFLVRARILEWKWEEIKAEIEKALRETGTMV